MFRKCYLPVLSLVLLLILSFPLICQSKTYYWYDITVPYENYEGINKIVLGSIVIIEVELPDFIKNYEEIPLIIDAEEGK